jgi:hypothetical protein
MSFEFEPICVVDFWSEMNEFDENVFEIKSFFGSVSRFL